MEYKKILIALEDSPLSLTIFERAKAIAHKNGAALKLVHCLDSDSQFWVESSSFSSETFDDYAQRLEASAQKGRQWLGELGRTATELGIATEWECPYDKPERAILSLAQDWGADLIVLGRRGRQGLAEMFLGSVSSYIIHHAPCSVLVVQGDTSGGDGSP